MYLKRVNVIYENIQKEGRFWQKLKKGLTTNYKDISKKIGDSVKEFIFQDTKKACEYLIKKYFPKIKASQLINVIDVCKDEEKIIYNDQTQIAEINKGYFCKELLKNICSSSLKQNLKNDQELNKAIQDITYEEYSPFYDVKRDNPSSNGTQFAAQCISKYNIQKKLDQLEIEAHRDPYKGSINHTIKQIKLV